MWVALETKSVEKTTMQPSLFNNRVPLPDDEVFLMNTFTDAQLVVSSDVVALLDRLDAATETHADGTSEVNPDLDLTDEEREVLDELSTHGFVVDDRQTERKALDKFFVDHHENTEELHLTVLTTLQCNFSCDYCLQGDHGEWNASVNRMSLPTAYMVCDWLTERLDTVKPGRFVLTFFGGEPLLNLEVLYAIAERAWAATQTRSIEMEINVITNGLLLTPDVVDRLAPYGLNGFKTTPGRPPLQHRDRRQLRRTVGR